MYNVHIRLGSITLCLGYFEFSKYMFKTIDVTPLQNQYIIFFQIPKTNCVGI